MKSGEAHTALFQTQHGDITKMTNPYNKGQTARGLYVRSTVAQDVRMRAYWAKVADHTKPGGSDHYNFFTNNCIQNVAGALKAAGNEGGNDLADIGNLMSLYPNLSMIYLINHDGLLPTNISDILSVSSSGSYTSGWQTVNPIKHDH